MSLTSFLKNKDVKSAFERAFKKPQFDLQAELLAPPLTNNYSLVGTAFDYLLRFYIKRLNPDAVEHRWISESALGYLLMGTHGMPIDYEIIEKIEETIQYAKKAYSEYINTGIMNHDLFKTVLLLAQIDSVYREGARAIYRNGFLDESNIDENDIKDLRNLISIVKPEYFKSRKICILNPTFGKASRLVGGADCDLIIDDAIIDIKTTKKLDLTRNYFDQLIGYYILYTIGNIDGMPTDCKVKRLGIYFSRYAYLLFIDVLDVIKENFFDFVNWFEKKASERFGRRL
ncbi:hypothetical protein [Pseudothermotoga elfii]|uniref:hypothetical protein n=1 Tax=Pseudothermotoga elfii TaxID=38322 RepID=UPI0004060DED|nr:hypothetical protein [Pseudothermotoga elfii]